MKVILVYPEIPETFWSFTHALKFISKKASIPPLGIVTVASMLPRDWELKLVDMNVSGLTDENLAGADYVFISAISVQKRAVKEIVARCARAGVPVVAGGPLFTVSHEEFPDIRHFVLDEAEITLPLFLEDLRQGLLKRVYTSPLRADIRETPAPRWELLDMKQYASMSVQYSRGCPFNCDFCDITLLYGRESRTKDTGQVLAELDELYSRGWRGAVFFVDDNFIGNGSKLKQQVLPAIIQWMEQKKHPFIFNTQVSINISEDADLMRLMTRAGFATVFIGIESPSGESLAECGKFQNRRCDLLAAVKKVQGAGLEVQGGFIIGFDNDPPSIFEKQVAFIQESGIVTAMVGLLNALKGTKLYARMNNENRLLNDDSGDNTDGSINFIPKMGKKPLLEGYKKVISTVYAPRQYYARIRKHLEQYTPFRRKIVILRFSHLAAFLRSVLLLGIAGKERTYFWKLLFWTLFTRPGLLTHAITFAIYGYHFRKISEKRSKEKPAFPEIPAA
ncbi:MAG: B12-binding domain-containing radical SAM protein [Endomicrobiales bacterium]